MEIKSSLLNDKYFQYLKESLIKASEVDNKQAFRVKAIEYINDTADNNDDMFFFDMVEFVRFLNPNDSAIAYTTPDHLIYLNAPGEEVGESVRKWDFIYCHECLHQLWETFGVAEEIKKAGYEYNHKLLNIASDCVINDFLKRIKGKTPFENGIFPENLKSELDVTYDPSEDTQFTLYLKLLKKHQEEREKVEQFAKDNEMDEHGEGESQEDDGNGSNGGSQKDGKKSNDSSKSGSGSNGDSKEDGEKSDNSSGSGKDGEDKSNDGKGSGKGDKDGKNGDDKSSDKQSGNDANKDSDGQGKGDGKQGGSGTAAGSGTADITLSDADMKGISARAERILDKYREKIGGTLGDFITKCKDSKNLRKPDIGIKVRRGPASWDAELQQTVNKYVRMRVAQKKRKYEKTYRRVKRGTGHVEFGQPIEPGRRVKEDKMMINVAFYIDRSGSMSGKPIQNVFDACFTIGEMLNKAFKREKVVAGTEFKTFAFDTKMREIPYGKRATPGGGTMGFDEILDFMVKNTDNFMINIILTDGAFEIRLAHVRKFLKDISGIVVVIANSNLAVLEQESKHSTQLFFIKADENFTLGA